jgi:uncharacterized protein YndB with AHSA1/START domain
MSSSPDPTPVVFRTERVLGHAPAAVYAAFADADRLARWWGPRGFTNSFDAFEFRAGGRWEFVMHGPDGAHHANASVFRQLVPAETVVIEHVSPPRFTLTVTLAPHAGGPSCRGCRRSRIRPSARAFRPSWNRQTRRTSTA